MWTLPVNTIRRWAMPSIMCPHITSMAMANVYFSNVDFFNYYLIKTKLFLMLETNEIAY